MGYQWRSVYTFGAYHHKVVSLSLNPSGDKLWKVCQWRATGLSFSFGAPISSTNKTDTHEVIQWKTKNTTPQ